MSDEKVIIEAEIPVGLADMLAERAIETNISVDEIIENLLRKELEKCLKQKG